MIFQQAAIEQPFQHTTRSSTPITHCTSKAPPVYNSTMVCFNLHLHTPYLNDAPQGTFESGETRLLFSSAQVDYVRYWLHAMNLTKTLLPMPYSDCLILPSELKHITTHAYPDGGSLRSAVKVSKLSTDHHHYHHRLRPMVSLNHPHLTKSI